MHARAYGSRYVVCRTCVRMHAGVNNRCDHCRPALLSLSRLHDRGFNYMHTGMHAYVHMHTCACLRACACTQTELLDEGFAAGGRLDSHVECPLDDHAVVRLEAHLR